MTQGLGVTAAVLEAITAHATACEPLEACGLLGGRDDLVTQFVPVANAAASTTRFELDGAQMLAAERSIESGGDNVVGVMHSHPTTEAKPSATDLRDAAVYDPSGMFVHIIVSTAVEPCVVRAFRVAEGDRVSELHIATSDAGR